MARSLRPETPSEHAPREPSFGMSTAQLGLIILFAAISVLFAATLVAYAITRVRVDFWRSEEATGLPGGLAGSTALLLGVSVSIQSAVGHIRQNRHQALSRSLWLTLAFATAFLIGQGFNWSDIAATEMNGPRPTLFAYTFYLLTGVHALHVLGGFVPLGIVLRHARQREYSSSRYEGVWLCAQYWHFLGIVWCILLAAIYVGA